MRELKRQLRQSWVSLVGAALVSAGYLLLGHGWPLGWLLLAASNVTLVVVAKITGQWGLFIAFLPMGIALSNFWRSFL